MSYIVTPDLGLELADPATVQPFETPNVNGNFLTLEAGIVADRVRLAAIEGNLKRVADLDALAALSLSGVQPGTVVEVGELRALFMRNFANTAWEQVTEARFASATARNNAYAKGGAAFRKQGARVYRTDLRCFQTYHEVSASRVLEGWAEDKVQFEATYSHSIANGGTASGDLTLVSADSSESVANAFVINSNGFATRAGGIYEITVSMLLPVNATGLSFVYVAPSGGEQYRVGLQTGDVRASVSANLYLAANTNVIVGQQQTSGAARTVTGRVTATYLGEK